MIGRQAIDKNPTVLIMPRSSGTVTFRNVGHVTIWLADSDGIEPPAGVELAPGESAELVAASAFYAALLPYSCELNIASSTIVAPGPYAVLEFYLSAVGAAA